MARNKSAAFTLVELLVVIAIITILAAMLLPTLEQSLSLSRANFCANNQRQCTFAASSYATEWNEYLPPWMMHNPNNPTVFTHFPVYLGAAYMGKMWDCWKCPSDKYAPVYYARYSYTQVTGNNSTTLNNWNGVSPMFKTNLALTEWTYTMNYTDSFRITQVDGSAIYGGEMHGTLMVINFNTASWAYGNGVSGRDQAMNMTYAHGIGAANFSFMDGHSELMFKTKANTDPRGNRWPGK